MEIQFAEVREKMAVFLRDPGTLSTQEEFFSDGRL